MYRWFSLISLILGALLTAPVPVQGQTAKPNPGISGDELHALLEKARAQHDPPALAAGIRHGGGLPLLAVVGVRKRGTKIAATTADQWHLGSNTKPFTALLIALLIDQGLLDWDTPLEKIFPDQAAKWSADVKKITPAHLLTHTSGLPSTGPLLGFLIGPSPGSPMQDRAQLLRSLDKVKLDSLPGEKYKYSNLGYVVLGAIIDQRGKASWETQLAKKIIQPLGIKHWGLGPLGSKDAVVQPWPHLGDGQPLPPDGVLDNPPVLNSAGRVHLTLADYDRFLAETLRLARGEKGLLKPATVQKVFTNPYPVSPHSLSGWVGFRKQVGDKGLVLVHNGSNSFNYCIVVLIPDQDATISVMTNQGGPDGPGARACHQVLKDLRDRLKP